MERPTGVTVLSVLNFIAAGFYLLGALAIFVGGAFLASMSRSSGGGAGPMALIAGIGAFAGVFFLIGVGLCLLVGIGLWKLANWARILEMVFMALGILFGLLGLLGSMANFHIGVVVWQLCIIGIEVWILIYLLKPHVKQAFGATSL